jgi:hypothetical protein
MIRFLKPREIHFVAIFLWLSLVALAWRHFGGAVLDRSRDFRFVLGTAPAPSNKLTYSPVIGAGSRGARPPVQRVTVSESMHENDVATLQAGRPKLCSRRVSWGSAHKYPGHTSSMRVCIVCEEHRAVVMLKGKKNTELSSVCDPAADGESWLEHLYIIMYSVLIYSLLNTYICITLRIRTSLVRRIHFNY